MAVTTVTSRIAVFLTVLLAGARVGSAAGASLAVHWNPVVAPRSEKISLLPVDIALPEGMTRAEAVALWTRPVSGAEQRWDALPPGTYQLVLRSPDAHDAPPPVDLGEVVLAPGDERTVSVDLPPPANQTAPTEMLRILIPEAAPEDQPVITYWRAGTHTRLRAQIQPSPGGLLMTAKTSCSSGGVLVVETPSAIGSATLNGACNDTLRVPLTARVIVTARVSVAGGLQLPRFASLHVADCPDGNPAEFPFVIADSRFTASVPANCKQIIFRANGFSPMILPQRSVKPLGVLDLGRIELREGAAAALRVRSAADASVLAGVRVSAVRAHDLSAIRSEADLDSSVLASAVTDESGWVRLSGLPPERFVFALRAPERRLPQISEPYALEPGTETVIDDLLLRPASRVYVTVSQKESVEKKLDIKTIELLPTGHHHWPQRLRIFSELTSTGAVIEDVPPGKWNICASGRLRNGFSLCVADTTIEVADGADQHVTLTVTDALYKGRVTRDGSPIAGTINLTPVERRTERRAAVAKIGADGVFEVLLEGGGQYSVALQDSASGGSFRLGHYVEFRDPDDEIEIELPSRRIRGRVVNSDGEPVSGAGVSATQRIAEPAASSGARVAPDGYFVIESVAAGTWEIVASTKTSQSESVVVSIGSSDVEDVTLRLDPIHIVKVRLTDMTGAPVREAFVALETPRSGSIQAKGEIKMTGPDGVAEFRLSTAQRALPMNLVFATLDLHLSCALRRPDADQSVTMPPSFGELRLVGSDLEKARSSRPWLLSSAGCAVPFMGTRRERDDASTPVVVFPRLSAGVWSLLEIRTPEELELLLTGRGANLTPVQSFTVESGKVTRVSLPQ